MTAVSEALDRLIDLAGSDTQQSPRAADVLLAWCADNECGHFPIADLFGAKPAWLRT